MRTRIGGRPGGTSKLRSPDDGSPARVVSVPDSALFPAKALRKPFMIESPWFLAVPVHDR